MSVNRVTLLGRLGRDPVLKSLGDGKQVCTFGLATSEKFKNKSGDTQERTEWHEISVWGQLAILCSQYLQKGSQAYLEGKLETRSWEKDGAKHYKTEIIANTVQFLDKKLEGKKELTENNAQFQHREEVDIPF